MQATRTFVAALLLVLLIPGRASALAVDGNGSWAGIEDNTHGAYRVTAEFTVPDVDPHCGPGSTSNAAVWVGLGGIYGNAFAQIGITLAPGGNGAWFELFDHQDRGPEVDVPLSPKPGDRVRIRLAFAEDHSTLAFVWNDLTTGQRVERDVDNAARFWAGGSAEWIVERSRQTLADFGSLTFDHAYYTDTDGLHTLAPADREAAIMYGPNFGKRATRTTVDSSTSASVKWLACD